MSNWMNEAGEPYMTAAALRFEAELDEQSAYERQYDDFYDHDFDDDFDEEEEEPIEDDDAPFVMEDQWLDGSYEQ